MPETTTEVEQGSNGHGPEPFTPKQLARLLHTDARTVRKFMRMKFGKIGQGNRWGLDPAEVESFTEAWGEWRKKIEARSEKQADVEEPSDDGDGDEMEVDE